MNLPRPIFETLKNHRRLMLRSGVLPLATCAISLLTITSAYGSPSYRRYETGTLPGTLNSTPAGELAVLRPIGPASLSRPYQRSALYVKGQLLTAGGQPIANARIEVFQHIVGSEQAQLVGEATTSPDGTFSAAVPPGPSRVITTAYHPYLDTGAYSAQSEVFENVTAGLRLSITPSRTTPTGIIEIRGRVLGQIPPIGVIVEVLVYYHGSWQPIRTPRTSPAGTFSLPYQFQGARGIFPFAIRVRFGQVGFPYGEARSRSVEVIA